MKNSKFKEFDFDNPSLGFRIEDKLKWLLGGPLLYHPFIRTFGLEGNETVLDFGCGGGAGSKAVLKHLTKDGHLTCLDTSKYWIDVTKKRLGKYPNVEFRLGDIRELDIQNSSVDVIFTIYVIHDIDPANWQSTIKALANKLKYGGKFFIVEPISNHHGMPVDEIQKLFRNAGLKEMKNKINSSRYIGEFQKY